MSTSPGWMEELNPRQREAVTHGDGPLLVIAGAGTGKTRTLACRVAHLISTGVSPERILLLTFTRRAAEEMLGRAAALASGPHATRRVWGGTFHAFANRILRIYAKPAGLAPEFSVIDRSDAEDLLHVVRNDLGLSGKGRRFPQKATCLDIYSRRVNSTESLNNVLLRHYPWCLEWENELGTLFRTYVERKQAQSVLDYDDLLLYLYYLLEDARMQRSLAERFDHILVDEYQDTNGIQAGILARLRLENRNIMVVGDDAQSIYAFRAATVRNMLDFPQVFPGATVVTLDQNYRSRQQILETTNRVIAQAHERFTKDLWSTRGDGQRPLLITCGDEGQEDEEVIRLVVEHLEQGIPLRRQAVLFRAASHSASLELALARRNIPFRKYGGLKFLEAAHVKDMVSLLRLIENPRDGVAWHRVLRLITGIGPTTAAAAIAHMAQYGYVASALASFPAPPAARPHVQKLAATLTAAAKAGIESPAVVVELMMEFYEPLLQQQYENPEPRRQDIAHLSRLAASCPSLTAFLDDLVLDPPMSTADLAGPPLREEDWLVLSTIHSAKGLEWDVAYLIHAADGCLPSDMATGSKEEIDEELRLAYVAMTRARDYLYVLWPLRFYGRTPGTTDRHVYAQRSRFLSDEVLASMEQRATAYGETGTGVAGLPESERDIGARIRDIWS
jgi:DNA helicase II / ATP-dependent DNA helicase PcrA